MKTPTASCLFGLCIALTGGAAERAAELVEKSGFQGGVVVQLDCGDGSLLAAIHQRHPNSLGHGVVRSEEQVSTARRALLEAGIHGKVTVGGWDGGMIPFIDNFVNLLIVDAPTTVPRAEILRVLAPMGTAIVGGEKITKPRPR